MEAAGGRRVGRDLRHGKGSRQSEQEATVPDLHAKILTDRHTESAKGGIILTLRQGVSWALTHKAAYSRVSAKTA